MLSFRMVLVFGSGVCTYGSLFCWFAGVSLAFVRLRCCVMLVCVCCFVECDSVW